MLEPYDGKLSRTVLRGEEGRKPLALPGPLIETTWEMQNVYSSMGHHRHSDCNFLYFLLKNQKKYPKRISWD